MPVVASHLKNFILPARYLKSPFDFKKATVCVIVPTYKPQELTVRLVQDLIKWNPKISVYVVDDSTPLDYKGGAETFSRIASVSRRVKVLCTPRNTLKAGALNYCLKYIFEGQDTPHPEVILTLDDDVVISPATVRNLVVELMSHNNLGAVCSQCRVLNKNKNLLTRLQGLEYVSFNAIRLADEGFFKGPLVMHGMLTAFRVAALKEAGMFAEGHLIEDYEMTTRLKGAGWSVKSAVNAPAATGGPERFSPFWRQRVRWSYGGGMVVVRATDRLSVLQDLIGHGVFFATVLMVGLLLVSRGSGYVSPRIAQAIVALSLLQLAIWYVFQLWLMRRYKEKDAYDWAIRVGLIPEFIYSYIMTTILVGSYLFLFFNICKKTLARIRGHGRLAELGTTVFRTMGYTESWGTRTH